MNRSYGLYKDDNGDAVLVLEPQSAELFHDESLSADEGPSSFAEDTNPQAADQVSE